MLKSWENLPTNMQTEAVRPYYQMLKKRKVSLAMKRAIDILGAGILTILLSPVLAVLAIWIKIDSKGPVFYRQERVTQYGRVFRICKFRTMVVGADKKGPLVTQKKDARITRVGAKLRKLRLDELPQIFNILTGDMSFVGTRPEVAKYVNRYSDEMKATLLLPAGVTSETSIRYKDEDEIIEKYQKETGEDTDEIYVKHILPEKMKYNLDYIRKFSVWKDLRIMIETALAVLR